MKKYVDLVLFLTSMNMSMLSAQGLIYVNSIENKITKGHMFANTEMAGSVQVIFMRPQDSLGERINLETSKKYLFPQKPLLLDLNKQDQSAWYYNTSWPSNFTMQLVRTRRDVNDIRLFLDFKNNDLIWKTIPPIPEFKNPVIKLKDLPKDLKSNDWRVDIILTDDGPKLENLTRIAKPSKP